jgi:hypothetical protein
VPAAGFAEGWKATAVGSVSFSAASFSNWSQGGEDFLAWNFGVNGAFDRDAEHSTWKNGLKLEYGLVNQGDSGARKSADQVFAASVYTRKSGWKLDPFVSANLKTQIAQGKDYAVTPAVVISDFADPLQLQQAAGLAKTFGAGWESRLGVSMQETMTDRYPKFSDDPRTVKVEKTRVQTGLESVSSYEGKPREGVAAKSKLRLFYSFNQTDQLDLDWANDVAVSIVKNLSLNYSLQMLYDRDVLSKLQVKQFMGVGLSLSFI